MNITKRNLERKKYNILDFRFRLNLANFAFGKKKKSTRILKICYVPRT